VRSLCALFWLYVCSQCALFVLSVCSLRAPRVLSVCSLRVPYVLSVCSLRAPRALSVCSLCAPRVLFVCALRALCVLSVCFLCVEVRCDALRCVVLGHVAWHDAEHGKHYGTRNIEMPWRFQRWEDGERKTVQEESSQGHWTGMQAALAFGGGYFVKKQLDGQHRILSLP